MKKKALKTLRGEPRRLSKRTLNSYRVDVDALSWRCNPRDLPFRTSKELKPLRRIIGQDKALRALSLGIRMESPGYNLFVCGIPGTGRMTAIRRLLAAYQRHGYRPVDLSYVANFDDPDRPKLFVLPGGEGARFRRDVHALLLGALKIRDRFYPPEPPGGPYPPPNAPAARRDQKRFRRELREFLRISIPKLTKTYPEEAVVRYLQRLSHEILRREGISYPEELGVNLISEKTGRSPPVVIPSAISYGALFGVVENRMPPEGQQRSTASFAGIRTGAIVDARGGILVLPAAEVVSAKGCWPALKNCLQHGKLELRDLDSATGDLRSALSPEAIPIDVKVILVGDYSTYDYLFDEDPDFLDLFKVRVDFDSEVDLRPRLVQKDYPEFIARIVRDEGLRHFGAAAIAKVIAFGVRRAGRKAKITTQFSAVADLVREASFWARRAGRRLVTAIDVEKALRETMDRLNLVETKMSEMINDGTILIDTSGSRIGQVNGLAVYDQGDYIFGKPSRITAETSVGQGGIINIERESGLSGKSHDKGIQILGGYLRSKFAQHRPLSLTASVCFEQSYSGVDGDSASSTEIYAILSSLSGLPIRQDLAVTGSMNQKGDIQPIGGVNEKIEGFFDCVRAGRSSGREGVIIPRRNLPDLMLRDDVLRAVRRGRFHIYAIRSVEEGIEILTGVPAGRRRKGGGFPPGTVFGRADRRLEEIAQGLRSAEGNK